MNVRDIVINQYKNVLAESGTGPSDTEQISVSDEQVLLESGLDSLGFAILVTQLEDELGYDPFVLMENAVYPRTLGEFIAIYEKYADHAKTA